MGRPSVELNASFDVGVSVAVGVSVDVGASLDDGASVVNVVLDVYFWICVHSFYLKLKSERAILLKV